MSHWKPLFRFKNLLGVKTGSRKVILPWQESLVSKVCFYTLSYSRFCSNLHKVVVLNHFFSIWSKKSLWSLRPFSIIRRWYDLCIVTSKFTLYCKLLHSFKVLPEPSEEEVNLEIAEMRFFLLRSKKQYQIDMTDLCFAPKIQIRRKQHAPEIAVRFLF